MKEEEKEKGKSSRWRDCVGKRKGICYETLFVASNFVEFLVSCNFVI